MSDDGLVEMVVLVFVSAVFATVAAALVGVPVGGLLMRNGSGRIMRASAWGVTRVVAPIFVIGGVIAMVADARIGLTFTFAAMVLVQASVALPVVIGSTAEAIGSLSPAAIEQLGALHLSRYQEIRILIVEAWPDVVASIVMAFAVAMAVIGGAVVAGAGVAGEMVIATPILVDEVARRRDRAAGLVLVGIATTAALARLPLRRLR